MKYIYQPSGVCSRQIELELDGDTVVDVTFIGGCAGNALGISALVKGQKIDEVIKRLAGIHCGFKPTSCPDQLTKALQKAKEEASETA